MRETYNLDQPSFMELISIDLWQERGSLGDRDFQKSMNFINVLDQGFYLRLHCRSIYMGGASYKRKKWLVNGGTRYQLTGISDIKLINLVNDLGQLIVQFLQPQVGKSLTVNRIIDDLKFHI